MTSHSNEEDIRQCLDQVITNDDAYELIADIVSKYKGKKLAEKLKETFDEVDVSHHPRIQKYATDFVKQFRNKIYAAQIRAEKTCKIESFYTKDKDGYQCQECEKQSKIKLHMTKHIRSEHKSEELRDIIDKDTQLQEYKSSNFYYAGIRTKKDNPPAASLSEESMAQRLKIKDDRIAFLQKQLKIQEKRADKAEEEARKNHAEDEDLNDTIDGDEVSPKLPAALTPDSDIIIINRNSSVKGSNALHATRYTPNESMKGRYSVKPTRAWGRGWATRQR